MDIIGYKDADIWKHFIDGEEWALVFIYSEYAEKLYRYGLKFTSEITYIEDSLQDLFSELIKNRKRLGKTDNIFFYLMKSYKRKLLRKIQTEKKFVSKDFFEKYPFDFTCSIEQQYIMNEISAQKSKILLKALNDLTPRQKEAIYLRYTKEMNYVEIAELMDISLEACRNLISKAVSALQKLISKEKIDSLMLFILLHKKFQ